MSSSCPECKGSTTWDDSVGSAVCTSCGTLTDPSQSVLTSQVAFSDDPIRYSSGWGSNLGKRPHYSSSWALSDQGKEARDSRNLSATLEFIESLAKSLNATGLPPRVMTLFRQAKEAIQFRWGRRAKLVAGACLAIALRESNRPDCLRDIAYLLEEPLPILSRSFVSLTSALGLTLSRAESASFVPILQKHVSSLMQGSSTSLPATLRQELSSISLYAVSSTAGSLSDVLARIGTQSVTQYPTPPIACAIFILALESEFRTTIKQLGLLAEALGARFNVGKGAIMSCYKAIQDVLASLVGNIPWLDKYETKKGRAKVAKRNVVARATKDIVAFYDDSWKATQKPTFNVISEDQEASNENDSEQCNVPRKKRKFQNKGRQAIQFLLDPVTAPVPKTQLPPLETAVTCKSTPPQSNYSLLSYFLSTHMTSQTPTRLQLLAAARGGADEITDEELFEQGELESLMRDEEEMKVIAHMYDWEEESERDVSDEEVPTTSSRPRTTGKHKTTYQDGSELKGKRTRIDLDALSRLLNDDGDDDSRDDEPFTGLLGTEFDSPVDESEFSGDEPEENTPPPLDDLLPSTGPSISTMDGVVIEDWRPPSPGADIQYEWYDEAYD
ncbi:hypothetical protein P691DRAFT_661264 [Macrolepiota fuliginosa MF-IS2]|uniref:TFIIB-type domain-containing protein n=1 Tax=Macrolepiota fuliginosa MF-IS2 TaxID=1400762 RepID=A0A9P5XIY4_9AGAR|nr:hypothetical protein P691DRAFT_661264 [Macrolepiota fuliginosa MF-IS2]